MRGIWLMLGVACNGSNAGEDSAAALCIDAPVLTWENYGQGLVVERCQSCHASTSETRNGAPEDVFFDTHEDAISHIDSILQRVVEDQTMPPQGGLDEEDILSVEIWLTCWEEGA
jgi:uncharacterized membrane protein